MKNRITPCLMFDNNAKEAFNFYSNILSDTNITKDYGVVVFARVLGVEIMGINGGPHFKPNPSISFMIVYESKNEIDSAWNQLISDGKILMPLDKYPFSDHYGWLQDKYGISWQLYLGKRSDVNNQAVIPTIMFAQQQQGKCKEALDFYQGLFQNFNLQGILEYPQTEMKNQIMHSQFVVDGLTLAAMDSGVPQNFTFNEGVSFSIFCKDQSEIDYFWNKITELGEESQCGWCKDQFGVSWQIVPEEMNKLIIENPKAFSAMLKMRKLIIEDLVNA